MVVPDWYGLPLNAGEPEADGKPEEAKAEGTSMTAMPKSPPLVGRSVMIRGVLPGYCTVRVEDGSTGPVNGEVTGIRGKTVGRLSSPVTVITPVVLSP